MIRFSKEKVLLLHQILIEQTGGEAGVRDMGLLESALASCEVTFDGRELFPHKEEKAARLAAERRKKLPPPEGRYLTGKSH